MKDHVPASSDMDSQDEQMLEHEILHDSQRPTRLSLQQVLAISSLTLLYNIALGAFVCIAPILSYINADIGPSPHYTWLASSYTIASGIGLVVAGALSDILGRRWFCVATGVTGIIGGIIGLVAKDIPTGKSRCKRIVKESESESDQRARHLAIVGMTFLGANGGLSTASFASICEIVPTKFRGYALGIVNGSICFWVACGSLIGHQMVMHTGPGWRSVFWMVLAINIVGTVATALTYHPEKPLASKNASRMQIVREFDYVGLAGIAVR